MKHTVLLITLLATCKNHDKGDTGGGAVDTGPQPIDVQGWGTDVEIAPDSGSSQSEPTATAMPDGTLVAAWMQLGGWSLYIYYSRSTDGGQTWSDPVAIDKDRYGYQNDPVLVHAGDKLYLTWLAVEYTSQSDYWTNIYCAESEDGGQTWSDRVAVTTGKEFNDRQWMAAGPDGTLVMTWDYFKSNGLMEQRYALSTDGCAGFTDVQTIATGQFLNGSPTIADDGTIWVSRDKWKAGKSVVQVARANPNGGWDTVDLLSFDSSGVDTTSRFEAEQEEIEERLSGDDARWPILSGGLRKALRLGRFRFGDQGGPTDEPGQNGFEGYYSPVLDTLPDGTLVVTSLAFQAGSSSKADTWFMTWDGTDSTATLLSDGSSETEEPWLVVDDGGGVHITWFDRREGDWRLYGASSVDGGDTFNTLPIGDDTFTNGFNDSQPYQWVGHFQGLTATSDHVYAVFGDSRDGRSRIYVDESQ